MGERLRGQLQGDVQTLLAVIGTQELLEHDAWGQQSIGLRTLHCTITSFRRLLRRARTDSHPEIQQAMMVTMAGILQVKYGVTAL